MLGFVIDLQKGDDALYTAQSVSFPDIVVRGATEEEACTKLQRAVERVFFTALKGKKLIPMPTKVNKNRFVVTFPALVMAKIYLVNTMIEKRIQKTELARRLQCHMQQIDRLLDFSHASKIERVEEALKVLGRGLELKMSENVLEELSVEMLQKP